MLTVECKLRMEDVMVLVDLGSRGPWLLLEDFQLDALSMNFIKNLFTFSVDAMASFKTCQCPRYFGVSFELECEAVDFFSQHLSSEEFYWVMKIPIIYLFHKQSLQLNSWGFGILNRPNFIFVESKTKFVLTFFHRAELLLGLRSWKSRDTFHNVLDRFSAPGV